MANKIIKMDSLKESAIHIYSGMISVFPHEATETKLELKNVTERYNGCYSLQTPTVGFIHNGEMYAIPYTDRVIRSLEAAGLKRKKFYVPFSNGDYPKSDVKKWAYLKEMVIQSYIDDLREDCITYSDKHNIKELTQDILEKCIEIPFMGLAVTGVNYETCYYPILSIGKGRDEMLNYIGKYNIENGTVMFVYRDGKTYLSRGYEIIRELKHAGYKQKNILVPLAHGEKINDEELEERWEFIKKLVK